MRELKLIRWCDLCAADDEDARVDATEVFTVAIVNGEAAHPTTRIVETCERHAKAFRDLAEVAQEHGTDPARLAAVPRPVKSSHQTTHPVGEYPCPVPGCGTVLRTSGSRADHVRRQHNTTIGALGLADSGRKARATETPKPCPVKGCSFVAAGGGGLGSHMKAAHPKEHAAAKS
jgi:hypothetical protein